MYKKRLAKWGLQKNSKRSVASGRSASTKDQCRSITNSHAGTPATTITIPTPPESSYRDVQMLMLLTSVRTWSVAFFETAMDIENPIHLSTWQLLHSNNKSINFTFKLVADLLDRGQGKLAGRMARKAFMMLEDMLTLDPPAFVWNLFEMMYYMVTLRHAQLFRMLLVHVTALVDTKMPEKHPLSTMLRGLSGLVGNLASETSNSAASSPSSSTSSDGTTTEFDPWRLSQALAPLLERTWNLNAEILFEHFDPRLFHIYCRMLWDSCSIGPPTTVVNDADHWLNRIHDDGVLALATSKYLLMEISEHFGDEERVLAQPLTTSRKNFSPPEDYDMLRAGSITALRQCGDAIIQKKFFLYHDTTMLLSMLAGLAIANVLERLPMIYEENGIVVEDEKMLRLHASNFACVLKTLVDLDGELVGEEVWGTLGAVERFRAVVTLRQYAEGDTDPQVMRELWQFRDVLLAAGRLQEAIEIEQDAFGRMERYIRDIPVHSV